MAWDWSNLTKSQSASLTGGFQVAAGLTNSWSSYNATKSNLRQTQANAQQLRQYAEDVYKEIKLEQLYREGSNKVSISTSGFSSGAFTDILRNDFVQADQKATSERDRMYMQAAQMEREAKRAKKKSKRAGILKGVVGAASIAFAPMTGGASLAIGGTAMGAFGDYL